jgi:chorismate dehydratase
MRIGAVNYLNSKPLVYQLERLATGDRVLFDLPSRLADSLSSERLDVALIPSVEFFRTPGYTIVSDAVVACRGAVRSVKLHFRVPPRDVKRIALDEGSRTSAALAMILLQELAGVTPGRESLPIGCGIHDTDADAVLLIGDRAMQAADESFVDVWDLGEKWQSWTGLPFVFAMWVARAGIETACLADTLAAARDLGLSHLAEIAADEAPPLGITAESAASYFRDNLHFVLGEEELHGLRHFYRLCVEGGFAPRSSGPPWEQFYAHGCSKS